MFKLVLLSVVILVWTVNAQRRQEHEWPTPDGYGQQRRSSDYDQQRRSERWPTSGNTEQWPSDNDQRSPFSSISQFLPLHGVGSGIVASAPFRSAPIRVCEDGKIYDPHSDRCRRTIGVSFH